LIQASTGNQQDRNLEPANVCPAGQSLPNRPTAPILSTGADMESKTKVNLSADQIEKLVEHVFGKAPISAVNEMRDGWFNSAYLIEMGAGEQKYVLKIGPPADAEILTYEKDILRAEVESMKMAATNPQIPVPSILLDDFSRRRLPYDYYFMDFIPGTTWDKLRDGLSAAQNKRIEFRLGEITAHINAMEGPAFGYFAFGQKFNSWTEAFYWMCRLLFADARRFHTPLALSEKEFFHKFDEHQAIFSEVAIPQLVHWDLWAGNIFITFDGENPHIAGIVDFERALWGDPLMEAYLGRLDGIPDYMAGYGSDLLASRTQRLRRIFYNIYLHLIMIIEDGPREYDDKRSVIWAKERLLDDMEMLRHGDILR
jgi:aminoglycoside phosphotransferase (APT) family kinase protein